MASDHRNLTPNGCQMATEQLYNETVIEEYVISDEPYYLAFGG